MKNFQALQGNIYADGAYASRNPSYHVGDSPWKAARILEIMERHRIKPTTVGEVGCGAGEILRQLQLKLPPEVLFRGYEISPQALKLAEERANDRLTFSGEDFFAADVASFDVLLCIDVFEHVEDYLGFLAALKPKGIYKVFHIPLDLSVQSVLRTVPITTLRRNVGHLHYFTKETALLSLEHAGYEIIGWNYTASGVERSKSLKARLMRLPRRLAYRINRDWTVRVLGGYSLLVLAR